MTSVILILLRKVIIIQLVLLCTQLFVYGQHHEITHELSFKVGGVAYNNKQTIPNGVKGRVLGLKYSIAKNDKLNNHRSYLFVDFNTGGLNRNVKVYGSQSMYEFYGGKCGVGGEWEIFNQSHCFENQIYIGGLLKSEAEFVESEKVNDDNGLLGADVFGRWTTGIDFTLRNQTKIKDIVIENFVCVPIVGFGYFPEAPYKSNNVKSSDSYYLYPNDLVFIGRLMQIDYEFKVGVKMSQMNVCFLYRYKYHTYSKGIENQKYMQHQFGIGIRF